MYGVELQKVECAEQMKVLIILSHSSRETSEVRGASVDQV